MAKTATKHRAKAPARKTAKPAARRKPAKPARTAKTAARRKPARSRPQRFTVSHPSESAFQAGLRTYALYRDLGISSATDGLVQAHVIRFVPPCRPEEVSKLHYHDVEFQMVYVLK